MFAALAAEWQPTYNHEGNQYKDNGKTDKPRWYLFTVFGDQALEPPLSLEFLLWEKITSFWNKADYLMVSVIQR